MRTKYLNELYRKISLDKKTKRRLISELNKEIIERENNGEKIEDILESLGDINELAKEFEDSYHDKLSAKKISYLNVFLIIFSIIMLILSIYNIILIFIFGDQLNYIITGYSDSSALNFLAFKFSTKENIIKIIIEIGLSIVSFIFMLINKKRKGDYIL